MTTLPLNPIDITEITLAPPDITQLTTKSPGGSGVFDVLMSAVKLHLLEEFNEGRVTGEEYSTVYIAALSAVMQQANVFLANHQNEEHVRAQIGLIRQQTVSELAQTDNDLPLGLGFNGSTVIEGLLADKKLLSTKQIELATSQIATATREAVLTGQKIITELAQTDSNISTAAAEYALNDDLAIDGIIAAQLLKLTAEGDLTTQKLVTEVANTSDTKPIALGEMDSTTIIAGMAKSQRDKTDREVLLLAQKTDTELAQVQDTVSGGTAVVGVIGKQKDLFQAQTEGFSRDAEQKAAKILVDSWSVSATVSEATANTVNDLDDASVGAVVGKLKTGIGA